MPVWLSAIGTLWAGQDARGDGMAAFLGSSDHLVDPCSRVLHGARAGAPDRQGKDAAIVLWAYAAASILRKNAGFTWPADFSVKIIDTALTEMLASAAKPKQSMLHIIWYIIVGFIVGLIARAVMPGAQQLGFILTTLLGIGGSIVGGLIGRLFSKPEPGSAFHPAGFIMSIIGAIILLFIWIKLVA